MRNRRRALWVPIVLAVLAGVASAADDAKEFAKELRQAQTYQTTKRYKECLQLCDKMLAQRKEPAQAKEIAWIKADTLILDSRPEDALKTLAELAKAHADDKKLQAAVALKSGDIQRLLKKPDAALAAYRKAAEGSAKEEAHQATEAMLRAADVLSADLKKPAEARAECQRLLLAYPLELASCHAALAKTVEAWRAESKWPEALGAARILYDAAGDEASIRNAAQILAQAFLSADGNLARANEFLAYQSYGPDGPDGKPDTPDDIRVNRLTEVKYPTLSPEAAHQFDAAIKAQQENYEGYRAKAFLCIYSGKPKEAAAQFRLAFKAASLAQVPAAAQELVLVGMKAHTASFRGLDRVFEYLSYGPKGKSGTENIADPFAGL